MGTSSSLIERATLSTIRLIPFHLFKSFGHCPRFPNDKHVTITLNELRKDMYHQSLIIFISHRWLQPCHPDNEDNMKYHLCVAGIEKILLEMTDGMKDCYLWFDFGCLDQNTTNPAKELKHLDIIIRSSDLIFTPIVDIDWKQRDWPESWKANYEVYPSIGWSGDVSSYINRGWCRLEMLYAAKIPLLEDNQERRNRFKGGLLFHLLEGKRPHILYGSHEDDLNLSPIIMDPLYHLNFDEYKPELGHFARESDKEQVKVLVQELPSWTDQDNQSLKESRKTLHPPENTSTLPAVATADNLPSVVSNHPDHGLVSPFQSPRTGYEKKVYRNGDVYEGEWLNGLRHGKGKFLHLDSIYEGDWIKDKKKGYGVLKYPSGEFYEGEFENNLKHGKGVYISPHGDKYEGTFRCGLKDGHGKFYWKNGDFYEGDFKNDHKEGKGAFTSADGESYNGDYLKDLKHGQGKFNFKNGDSYEGEYRRNVKEGHGKYICANGDIYEGEYLDNTRHGKGTFFIASTGEIKYQEYHLKEMIQESSSPF